jgi:hypothetical protein
MQQRSHLGVLRQQRVGMGQGLQQAQRLLGDSHRSSTQGAVDAVTVHQGLHHLALGAHTMAGLGHRQEHVDPLRSRQWFASDMQAVGNQGVFKL